MGHDKRLFPLIYQTIPYAIFTIDRRGSITSFNRKAEELTGFCTEEVLGCPCSEVLRSNCCMVGCPLKSSMVSGEGVEDREVVILRRDGQVLPVSITTAVLQDERGKLLGGVEMFRDLSIRKELQKRLDLHYDLEDLVGGTPVMTHLSEILPQVASSTSPVLLQGESGTGKELVARLLHNLGPRRRQPFVIVHCGRGFEGGLERELFGRARSVSPGEEVERPGRFWLAGEGTLLLDELEQLSPAQQLVLLEVLEERSTSPGARPNPVRVRLLSSSKVDLAAEVAAGRFHRELYARLNVVGLELPPLRERKADIPLLVERFSKRCNVLQGRVVRACSERALAVLGSYAWPGNVRELENAVEHAFLISTGEVLQVEDFPKTIWELLSDRPLPLATPGLKAPLRLTEQRLIRDTLQRFGGNRTRAAEALGISRITLWRKLRGGESKA
ncbi:MAG: hypothetical protein A2284_06190 [Deltaproteobacteria bacterium RIFOXYA12_FULL_61_11]|nr:MAG: hypothetical protein A2284_06190 [Deltaproteobacteria bacterium RIFOXYA12_FULL_61_11]